MEKLKRRLFFWALVGVFFIVAPAVILYARGYRFDFHRGVFVFGGAVTLKTNPQNINISLNGESLTGKINKINNSHNLTGIIPGDYDIKVSLPGYRTWDKKTDIHSGLASEFWNVLLVRENYEKVNYSDTSGIDKFFISPKNDYVAYTVNGGNDLGVKIFNISAKKNDKNYTISGWQMIGDDKKENIEWSPNEDYLSVPVKRTANDDQNQSNQNKIKSKTAAASENSDAPKTEYAYFIIDPANDNTFNLNDFLSRSNIRDVRWDPKDKDYLFFLDGNQLYRANIKNPGDIVMIADNVSAFNLTRSEVYYLQLPNNLVFKSSLDGQSNRDQITNNFPENGADISRMIIYDESRIAFIAANGDLFIYNEGEHDNYFKKIGSGVEGVHFSDDGKKMLFWSNNEISVYFTRDLLAQPTRAENDLTNITRYSDKIDNVQWLKDYEHVIFNTGRWVKVIELDGRDKRNCMDLINTDSDAPFIRYNNSLEYLFFTDKTGDTSTLQSIIFPEPTPLFGIGG